MHTNFKKFDAVLLSAKPENLHRLNLRAHLVVVLAETKLFADVVEPRFCCHSSSLSVCWVFGMATRGRRHENSRVKLWFRIHPLAIGCVFAHDFFA